MTAQHPKKTQLRIRSLESKVTPMCYLTCEGLGGAPSGSSCLVDDESIGNVQYAEPAGMGSYGLGQLAAVADY